MEKMLPSGMKAVGGIGNGVFEIAEDLVGFESLCLLQADEPDTFSDLFKRIGDLLCRMSPDGIYEHVLESATRFRATANGYALGSGNSIPAYVPSEGYLAMIRAGREIRIRENT